MNPERPSRELAPQELEGLEADLFDYAKARDYLGFAWGALRRHKVLFGVVCVAVFGLGAAVLSVLPRTYTSDIKIQAQRNQVISTLAGLNRNGDWDLPTRAASDLITRTDNLITLVRSTGLARSWEANRPPALKLKDKILGHFKPPRTQEQLEEILLGTLEKHITVTTGEDTVTIEVDWSDAQTARALVVAAHESFLEARRFREVSAISEAIGLLESRANAERDKLTEGIERLQHLRANSKAKTAARTAGQNRVTKPAAAPVDPEVLRMRSTIQSKQQAITEMEDVRRRRVIELEARMAQLKAVYSDSHPAVLEMQDDIQQLQRAESPQLASLREELRRVEEEYEHRGGSALETGRTTGRLPAETARLTQTLGDELESTEIEQAKNDLRYILGKYSSLLERIDAATLDRETQRAAFRYRYGVLRPASLPLSPTKPKVGLILAASAVVGLLMGFLAALLVDLRSRRILESWQVERMLNLPLLGEVHWP